MSCGRTQRCGCCGLCRDALWSRTRPGVVLIVTLGTGIGTALFIDGHLVPNTELGHIEIRGKDAEVRASANARERKDWSWKKWARRVDEYLKHMNAYLWPDLIIIGAGSAKGRQILAALDR